MADVTFCNAFRGYGAAGLYATKERGGIAVVQDPVDSLYPAMREPQ